MIIFRKKLENILKIQKWLTLRRVQLRAVLYVLRRVGSQQLKFTADPKVSNTAWSFARNNFVSAGLSLPSMRILNFLKYVCTIAT